MVRGTGVSIQLIKGKRKKNEKVLLNLFKDNFPR